MGLCPAALRLAPGIFLSKAWPLFPAPPFGIMGSAVQPGTAMTVDKSKAPAPAQGGFLLQGTRKIASSTHQFSENGTKLTNS